MLVLLICVEILHTYSYLCHLFSAADAQLKEYIISYALSLTLDLLLSNYSISAYYFYQEDKTRTMEWPRDSQVVGALTLKWNSLVGLRLLNLGSQMLSPSS